MSETKGWREPGLPEFADQLRQWDPIYPTDRFSGRGIVVAAGGARFFTNAYVLVSILRRTLGCTLPIEIWHFGSSEMSATMASLLAELEVTVVDALPRIEAAGSTVRDGWQLKSFILLHSRFEQVLMLDADQVPVSDPVSVFDWPEYVDTGAVFWPDIVNIRAESPIWASLGLPGKRTTSLESGQILVDKRRHWRGLSIALALNERAEELYTLIYGDKDSFLVAFMLAEERCSLVPHQPFIADGFRVQRDFSGAPLFQHLTNAKWSYADQRREIEGLRHVAACFEALATLRARWNGRIFHAPDRSAAARAAEADVIATGRFTLEDYSEKRIELELRPFGEIGDGRSLDRQNWWCEEDDGTIVLYLRDADRVSHQLRRGQNGQWLGRRFGASEVAVSLNPNMEPPAQFADAPGLADELLRAAGFPNEGEIEWQRLRAAFDLLGRVEPGVLHRLQVIAFTMEGPDGDRLKTAIAEIQAKPAIRSPAHDISILRVNYRPVLDDGNA